MKIYKFIDVSRMFLCVVVAESMESAYARAVEYAKSRPPHDPDLLAAATVVELPETVEGVIGWVQGF